MTPSVEPGERTAGLTVTEDYHASVVKFEILDGYSPMIYVQSGRGWSRIQPKRATVEYRDGWLYHVAIEGIAINKDGTEAAPRSRWRSWWWHGFGRPRPTWPPGDAPALAVELVEEAARRAR